MNKNLAISTIAIIFVIIVCIILGFLTGLIASVPTTIIKISTIETISISTVSLITSSFKTITTTVISTLSFTTTFIKTTTSITTTTLTAIKTEVTTSPTTLITTTQPPLSIYINEVEANPPGTDEGNEWIELYNPNNFDVDLNDWHISTTHGATVTVRFTTSEMIPAKGYLVVSYSGQWIDNEDESLLLFDSQGRLVDSTPLLSDIYNDNKSWQRVPDGSNNWKLKTATPNAPN